MIDKVPNKPIHKTKSDAALIFLTKEEAKAKKVPAHLEGEIGPSIVKALLKCLETGDFKGELKDYLLLYPTSDGPLRVAVQGIGEAKKLTTENLRRACGLAARRLEDVGVKSLTIKLPPQLEDMNDTARAALEGTILGSYKFDKFKGKTRGRSLKLSSIDISSVPGSKIRQGAMLAKVVTESVCLARDLANTPSTDMTPDIFATIARKEAKKAGLKIKVFEKHEIIKNKMAGLLAVSRGSHQVPRFVILEHHGGKKGDPPIALVGKGVTFDSGGISIKPSAGMDEMKYDMSGAAAVLATMRALAMAKVKKNVMGLMPLTENLPGGNAYKPGDVIKYSNGVTAEVLNTDAEGRLILADALIFATKYNPKAIIDLATLTGACVIALGNAAIGLLGNNDTLISKIKDAGEQSGEIAWQLPLFEDYYEQIKSDVADIKNTGGRGAGTITAAAFLSKFVGKCRWAHLDIAGTAWESKGKYYNPRGSTGAGVRIVFETVRSYL